jgi:hypothetical protein
MPAFELVKEQEGADGYETGEDSGGWSVDGGEHRGGGDGADKCAAARGSGARCEDLGGRYHAQRGYPLQVRDHR